jgi:hypothetical protein
MARLSIRRVFYASRFSLILIEFPILNLIEYFEKSDREKVEGLPVAPFMDREKVTKPSAQVGFIKFVLIPLFETVAKVSFENNLR